MSKKSSQLKIDECDIGDVCWVILQQSRKPVYGTISKKYENENAIQVTTNSIGYRTVACSHAFWEENDAKEFKKNNK